MTFNCRSLLKGFLSINYSIKAFCFKMICHSFYSHNWALLPTLPFILADLAFTVYFGLQFHSLATNIISILLIHLNILILTYFLIEIGKTLTYYNYDMKENINRNSETSFKLCTIFCVPFIVLKILILFYLDEIEEPIFPTLTIQLIWGLISLPMVFKTGVLFSIIFWIHLFIIYVPLCFFWILYCLMKDVRDDHYFYYDIINQLTGWEYESRSCELEIFLESKRIDQKALIFRNNPNEKPLLMGISQTCAVCGENMNRRDDILDRLPCQDDHIFHQNCLKEWISRRREYKCPICKVKFNINIKDSYNGVNYSWSTRLHYYMKTIHLLLWKYFMGKQNYTFVKFYIYAEIVLALTLLFLSIFTYNMRIRLLFNSLISPLIIQLFPFEDMWSTFQFSKSHISVTYFLGTWKSSQSNDRSQILCQQRLHEMALLSTYILMIISAYVILCFDSLGVIPIIFLSIILVKLFLDILVMFAPFQIFMAALTLIFDLLFVLPVTIFNMAKNGTTFTEVNLLI